MTSMSAELATPVAVDEVAEVVAAAFSSVFSLSPRPVTELGNRLVAT
jgi:hypothetical protein